MYPCRDRVNSGTEKGLTLNSLTALELLTIKLFTLLRAEEKQGERKQHWSCSQTSFSTKSNQEGFAKAFQPEGEGETDASEGLGQLLKSPVHGEGTATTAF